MKKMSLISRLMVGAFLVIGVADALSVDAFAQERRVRRRRPPAASLGERAASAGELRGRKPAPAPEIHHAGEGSGAGHRRPQPGYVPPAAH